LVVVQDHFPPDSPHVKKINTEIQKLEALN